MRPLSATTPCQLFDTYWSSPCARSPPWSRGKYHDDMTNVRLRYDDIRTELASKPYRQVAANCGCDLHHLISSTFRPSACQLSVVAPFRLPVLRSGTAYQMTSPPLCACQPSGCYKGEMLQLPPNFEREFSSSWEGWPFGHNSHMPGQWGGCCAAFRGWRHWVPI